MFKNGIKNQINIVVIELTSDYGDVVVLLINLFPFLGFKNSVDVYTQSGFITLYSLYIVVQFYTVLYGILWGLE